MYYEAIKAAFNRFPVDPPGSLRPGDYVRIGWGGKLLHLGSLSSLLKTKLDMDIAESELEYLSNGVTKAQAGLSASQIAEAKIGFSNKPGLYIRGKRRVFRLRNIDMILTKLANVDIGWSIRRRIVVETHDVENADIVCSGDSSADIKVRYDPAGTPIAVDSEYARQQRGLLHLPNVSGTIAFGAIFFSRFGIGASRGSGPLFRSGPLDVNDREVFEESVDDDE
jgi:hypothetical protein